MLTNTIETVDVKAQLMAAINAHLDQFTKKERNLQWAPLEAVLNKNKIAHDSDTYRNQQEQAFHNADIFTQGEAFSLYTHASVGWPHSAQDAIIQKLHPSLHEEARLYWSDALTDVITERFPNLISARKAAIMEAHSANKQFAQAL